MQTNLLEYFQQPADSDDHKACSLVTWQRSTDVSADSNNHYLPIMLISSVSWELSRLPTVNTEKRNGGVVSLRGLFTLPLFFGCWEDPQISQQRPQDGRVCRCLWDTCCSHMRNLSAQDKSFLNDCREITVLITDLFKKSILAITVHLSS